MLKSCSQRLYLLKLIRDQGLPRHYSNAIFDALVLSKLRYAICVWVVSCQPKWPGRSMHFSSVHLSMASVIQFIGAIAEEADKVSFKKVMTADHCIHFLLPLLSQAGTPSELKNIHMSSADVNMNYILKVLYSSMSVQKL